MQNENLGEQRTNGRSGGSNRRQGVFWMLTIPAHEFVPYPVPGCSWIKGQLEEAASGYVHWQIIVATEGKQSLRRLKTLFGDQCHAELTRSEAAADYVWKEETAIVGTRFEIGAKPFRRDSRSEWEQIWQLAKEGRMESVEAQVRICHYRSLRAICADYSKPIGIERICFVYWGPTGTGKSRRAWGEAGMDAYAKDPLSKFWCGYSNHRHVVIDEFRGGIQISHILRWLDRYPVNVEIKGSSVPLCAEKFWITSNIRPQRWYPDLDDETLSALIRRLTIVEF